MELDIVDVQLHLGPGPVEPTLVEMDALGVRSVLIEEYWVGAHGEGDHDALMPGYRLPNGAWRSVYPTAMSASLRYPDRFAYFVRLDRRDPGLEQHMRTIAAEPGAKGFRVLGCWSAEETAALADGAYDALFDVAQDVGLPVCIFVPGHVELLPRYLRRFPRLQFVLDHLGIGMRGHPPGRSEAEEARTGDPSYFSEVLKLAEFPNLAVKLSHAPMLLRAGDYPFDAVRPYLRRAIEAFGADRLLWASDAMIMPHYAWADLLNYLRLDPELSDAEKSAILGANARRVFNWPRQA
jgi:L-fuconolactonase